MNFPRKMQSRLWCVSIIYRKLTRNENIEPIQVNLSNKQSLQDYFRDNVVFEYSKGDIKYFIDMYNIISTHNKSLTDCLRKLVRDERSISRLVQIIVKAALAELLYMGADMQLLTIEYTKLLNNFGEHEANKFIKDLALLVQQEPVLPCPDSCEILEDVNQLI